MRAQGDEAAKIFLRPRDVSKLKKQLTLIFQRAAMVRVEGEGPAVIFRRPFELAQISQAETQKVVEVGSLVGSLKDVKRLNGFCELLFFDQGPHGRQFG